MLQIKNIIKTYVVGDLKQDALKGVSINFRENEFVSILGQSGSGKTTLLNIIGGLDRYTSGDLIINGVSTKKYKDADWDIYRNNSIGFVFQSYNLIPHQTVLANVELALTLAGISKRERRERAVAVLKKVGLGDHLNKKPNQMSGGQMQRVAIARALINNPDILLADEPTGALDSETSIQIMELLKEIAKDKLVIMVTHNPELAQKYSTRIVNLLDGKIVSDTNPYTGEEELIQTGEMKKKVSMSFLTALSLSFNNLRTKKGRTMLTAFAGSIGIIGIALILALSSGMQDYISQIEEDTLSSYPITIQNQGIDLLGTRQQRMDQRFLEEDRNTSDKIYQNGFAGDTLKTQTILMQNNDLAQFKSYLDSEDGQDIVNNTSAIQFGYDLDLQIYKSDMVEGITQVNPSPILESNNQMNGAMSSVKASAGVSSDIWSEMIGNEELLESQYDVLAGTWPEAYNEAVIVVDENNSISDMTLYALGLKDATELEDIQKKLDAGLEVDSKDYETVSYTFDELLNLEFKLLNNTDYYEKDNEGIWVDRREDTEYMTSKLSDAVSIKIVGILRPSEEAAASAISGTVAYTSALTEYMIEQVNNSEIVKEQTENPTINVFTGNEFISAEDMSDEEIMNTLPEDRKAQLMAMPEAERATYLASYKETLEATYDRNLETLGVVDLEVPSSVSLYLKDFESRDIVIAAIDNYNNMQTDAGHDEYVIEYTDLVGIMTASITNIIDMITYLLIGFVSISLVVSSIMIGIITYISVLERTKEIGILRSIGASKRDISRVFNAETVIVGLTAGLIGIGLSLLLTIPANIVIEHLSGISGIASLPLSGAIVLIVISVVLTLIAGLIPAKVAAKKDPVIALRSE